jgi:hypothetical protein
MVSKDIKDQFEELKSMARALEEIEDHIEILIDLAGKKKEEPLNTALNGAIHVMVQRRDHIVAEIDKKF